jgi:deoxyribodipyrimidine photo-lyase
MARRPHILRVAQKRAFRGIAWDNDRALLSTWKAGETGVPMVDAGMRELDATGWMHNRARMVVASYLTKDLLIDWRRGETHFMQHLVDGDPANNNAGWQWTAGTGADAAPYFRVFNPSLQGKRFDPEGDYVRRWVPEIRGVKDSKIHEPWRMTAEEQRAASCRIGDDYPAPVVDHSLRRLVAIERYKAAAREFDPAAPTEEG